MAFDGIFPGAKVVPAPCGLLSVATVPPESRDEDWLGGYDAPKTTVPTVRLRSTAHGEVENGELSVADPTEGRFFHVVPFNIEIEIKTSGLNVLYSDPLAEAQDLIKAVSQKAVEEELWEGYTARSDPNDNLFLRATGGAQILTTAPVHPKRGLAMLEEAIGWNAFGGGGIIHMTRGTASSIVGGGINYTPDPEDQSQGAMFTSLGTPVVPGSGYTGNGPIGASGAAATATNKWMYATGPVEVRFAPAERVNDSLKQGFNARTNDSIVRAFRPAAVSFDTSIFYAVQVTLPDIP